MIRQKHKVYRKIIPHAMKIKNNGYTLIEILIVILIISIVTSVALLNINNNKNRRIESFANEFLQMMTLAEENAMLQPQILGVTLSDHAIRFLAYESAAIEKKNKWQPWQNDSLSPLNVPDDIELRLVTLTSSVSATKIDANDDDQTIPQIMLSTNGDVTPFTLYVGKKGEKPRYAISADADGNISNKLLS